MIKRYNTISLGIGVPGLLLQGIGQYAVGGLLGALVTLVGTALLIVGLAFYAKSRGRHPAWGLFGLLSCIGIVVLAFLKDKAPDG